jgi:hypothetical protein
MSTSSFQTYIPADGALSLTVPEFLRGQTVILQPTGKTVKHHSDTNSLIEQFVQKVNSTERSQISDDEYVQQLHRLQHQLSGKLGSDDLSDLRDEEDRKL